MKGLRNILWIVVSLMVAFLLFLMWYQYRYSMDVVESYEVNAPKLERKLLIATQGSAFKNGITKAVVEHFKSNSIYIKVIDVGDLGDIDPNRFNAILVVHTWENWKPPAEVKSFVERTKKDAHKIVILTTSGEGSYTMEGVDALTGESILSEVPVFSGKIVERLTPLLNIKA